MKVLLIGPFPPPHGGISVHVSGIHRQLLAAGEECGILDTSRIRPGVRFAGSLMRRVCAGWTLHLHTNGHNLRSWLVALFCAVTGRVSGGCILTLHSGMAPAYLNDCGPARGTLASIACRLSKRVICASAAIREAVLQLGVTADRAEVMPAFVGTPGLKVALNPSLLHWMRDHRPVLSTVLFFRPEYGFDLLVDALGRLRASYPTMGCLVMGSGEDRSVAEKLVRNAGLEDCIRMPGDLDHETCLSLISASDVFVRPTREDGDSISVREAISLGVPTVASSVGTRPAGTLMFPRGDVEAMAARIEQALTTQHGTQERFADCVDRLMEIYRESTFCLTETR